MASYYTPDDATSDPREAELVWLEVQTETDGKGVSR